MPEFCTCGAKLPEDARFCHKCGKPQRDEPLINELGAAEPPPLPPPPVAVEPPPIGFHNRIAVWIAWRVGVMALLLSLASGILSILWLTAAGYVCVYLYRRRTGQQLSVSSGAHLGWIAGVFGFAVSVLFITMFVVGLNQPEFLEAMRQQLQKSLSEKEASQALELIRSPLGIGSMLVTFFGLCTLLPAFGGAIGAKLLGRR